MNIDTHRLKEIREKRRLSLTKLAKNAGVTRRHLQRLENNTNTTASVREVTLYSLAKALNVDPEVLTGELPIPELKQVSKTETGIRTQISTSLLSEVRLAYGLIKRRYGVKPITLFNAAPLMFVLLAEGSLCWREEKLGEVQEAAENLGKLGFGHLSFAATADRAKDGAHDEAESIQKLDLFGKAVGEDAFDFGYDPSINNPFADYLRELVRKIDNPEVIEVDGRKLGYGPLEDFPNFSFFEEELDQITGGSSEAKFVLQQGYARIDDIEDELWADDATARRVKWLEEKLPESLRDSILESLKIDTGEESK